MNKKIISIVTTLALGATTMNLVPLIANAQNPVPLITNISPAVVAAGSADITLTVNGADFMTSSVIYFNGSAKTTFYDTSSRLTTTISASSLVSPGNFSVNVLNPVPGGGFSNTVTLTVNPATSMPVITSISPSQVTIGGASFNLVVNGYNFVSAGTPSVVKVNGVDRVTTVVSSTQLQATIPSADINSSGTRNITVYNAGPNNPGTSNTAVLTVNPVGVGSPVVTSISPSSKVAGSSGFMLTVNGLNFNPDSMVRFNGLNRATTYVSSTTLTALILSSDLQTAGVHAVNVSNPGGGTSNSVLFTISAVPGLPDTGIGPNNVENQKALVLAGLVILSVLSIISVSLVRIRSRFNG